MSRPRLELELDFPVTYEVEQLDRIDRSGGRRAYGFPDAVSIDPQQDVAAGPILGVEPEAGDPWVGVFYGGGYRIPPSVTVDRVVGERLPGDIFGEVPIVLGAPFRSCSGLPSDLAFAAHAPGSGEEVGPGAPGRPVPHAFLPGPPALVVRPGGTNPRDRARGR